MTDWKDFENEVEYTTEKVLDSLIEVKNRIVFLKERGALLELKENTNKEREIELNSKALILKQERDNLETIQNRINTFNKDSIIHLSVGGKQMDVPIDILLSEPSSMLAAMFSGRHDSTKCTKFKKNLTF